MQEAATRMVSATRSYDAVGRYGGEEFLIVLPGCDERCTQNQAERVRLAIHSTPIHLPEGPLSMSASFGYTSVTANRDWSAESLIQIADEALYKAKRLGRNRAIYGELRRHGMPDDKQTPVLDDVAHHTVS